MTETPAPAQTQRLMSLDAFRGITIAGMLLVNNPGSWSNVYWPLLHAEWNGWTFTDLIFPFFLFIVGVAMMFSFPKRLARGESRAMLFGHVVRRSVALILLGWWGGTWSAALWPSVGSAYEGVAAPGAVPAAVLLRAGFVIAVLAAVVLLAGTNRIGLWGPLLVVGLALFFAAMSILWRADVSHVDPLLQRIAGMRYPGVLVRIGVCYFFASAIFFLTPSPRALIRWVVALLAIHWVWMLYIPIPGFGMPDLTRGFPTLETPREELFSNWCFYIDHHVLGTHVWGARELHDSETGDLIWSFDPEGILSTVSAICSVLLGVLTGLWITREDKTPAEKTSGLFAAGCWLLVIGLVMSIWFPINKRIWTSSYTVFMAGMALLFLGMCYHTIDVKGHRGWCRPFVWYGVNAITAFVLSGMMITTLFRIGWHAWLMKHVFNAIFDETPKNASLAFAVFYVALWAGLMGILHWRRIYLKL